MVGGAKLESSYYWEQAAGFSNPNMADLADLPQTRIKRNYHCSRCYFFTQNPRSYLYHLKEEHGEKLRIYECQLCIYASRHNQKLQRHLRMVHDLPADGTTLPSGQAAPALAKEASAKLLIPASTSLRTSRSSSDSNPLFIPSPKSPKRSTRRSHIAQPPTTTTLTTSTSSASYTVGPPVKRTKVREDDHAHLVEAEEDMDELLDEDNDSSGTGAAMAEAEMMEEDYLDAEEAAEAAAAAAEEEEEEELREEEAERDRAYHSAFRSSPGKSEELLRCSVCDFVSKSRVLLQRHERLVHLKKKFFRCVKCNYVTHVKARYTKHVKYHSMPMIKCDMCEFRTPYKWNLDRHLKNHMGGGMYQCSLCNFTAHIKQSLTVHIQNHHLTPERARVTRRRNKVGASDEADASMDAEELDLLRFEREEELPDMGDDLEEDHEMAAVASKRHTPASPQALALSLPKHATGDVLTKTDPINFSKPAYECRFCPFKTVWESDVQLHESQVHGAPSAGPVEPPLAPKPVNKPPPRPIPNLIPIGSMLANPSASVPDKATPTILRIPQIPKRHETLSHAPQPTELSPPILEAVGLLAKAEAEKLNVPSVSTSGYAFPWNTDRDLKNAPPTGAAPNTTAKTSSFFEQLAEKLAPTNINQLICQFCGHEAKCLSEAVRHQKLHSGGPRTRPLPPPNPMSLSSRCQYCRHRCKTRLDLLSHLKTCPEAQLALEEEQNAVQMENLPKSEEDGDNTAEVEVMCSSSEPTARVLAPRNATTPPVKPEPHPMENKVFVWNQPPPRLLSTAPQPPMSALSEVNVSEGEGDDGISVASDLSETSMVGIETVPGIGTVTEGHGTPPGVVASSGEGGVYRKVYRCPHCTFWSNTASRFHVHIVGHSNSKPFECSQCNYRSNWRWDITKHIKLKGVRDSAHRSASIVILDPAGERHPQQYDQYLTTLRVMENSIHSRVSLTAGGLRSASPSPAASPRASPSPGAANLESFSTANVVHMRVPQPPKLTRAQTGQPTSQPAPTQLRQPPPLTALRSFNDAEQNHGHGDENRRTVWKCKRCIFKDGNRDKVVEHIRSVHYGGVDSAPSTFDQDLAMTLVQAPGPTTPISVPPFQSSLVPTPVPAFRCGVCNQVSNWKHVIQRHCRLKHNGNIQVVENRIPEDDGPVLTKESQWSSPSKSPNLTFYGRRGRGGGRISLERKVEIARQSAEEDGLGYILHPDRQQYLCSTCRFACRSLTDMELHRGHHNTNIGLHKCRFCTYNTNQDTDLSEHLRLHGVENGEDHQQELGPEQEDENLSESVGKRHKCPQCPYVSDSKSQFLYHKQFHRPRGAPFKCTQCSYNVSRRHLLNQHLRVHGLPPLKSDGSETPLTGTPTGQASNASYASESEAGYDSENCLEIDEDALVGSGDCTPPATTQLKVEPPPSIGSASNENLAHLNLNPQRLPRLSDADTRSLPDIPLTWVSRPDGKFCKMFKCRYCPHVNFRKVNIQEHEKRHQSTANSSNNNNSDLQRCHLCNYRCNNAGVLSAHVKVHQYILGVIHGLVDPTVTDEDQLQTLAALGDAQWAADTQVPSEDNTPRLDLLLPSSRSTKSLGEEQDDGPEKLLHFCQNCPARFLNENELVIHEKFHLARFTHRCDMCSYTARQKHHLLAHLRVHSREYQDRTQYLLQQYPVSEQNPQPQILAVQSPDTAAAAANQQPIDLSAHATTTPSSSFSTSPRGSPNKSGVSNSGHNAFKCAICPATFSKIFALEYHRTLHGGAGAFKCKYCDYAVKTAGNLAKHENLHKKAAGLEEESVPLSGVELARQMQHHDLASDAEDFEDEDCPEVNGKSKGGEEDEVQYSKHGRLRAKRFKCAKCPSAFEKREQYDVHMSLHGSQHHYRCDKCDYAVKNYASYLQHIRKHDIHEALTNHRDSELEDDANFDEEEDAEREDEAELRSLSHGAQVDDEALHESTKVILSLAEQQQLMLQKRRMGSAFAAKKESESSSPPSQLNANKKWFACHLCPYSASRKEFVDSHCLRHELNGGAGAFKCDFCDYRAAQKHLLKEHSKWHFKSRKQWAKLDGYLHYSSLAVTSRPRKPSVSCSQQVPAEECLFSTEEAQGNAWNEDEEDEDGNDNLVIDLSTGETVLNYPAEEMEGGAKDEEEMEEQQDEYNDGLEEVVS